MLAQESLLNAAKGYRNALVALSSGEPALPTRGGAWVIPTLGGWVEH